MVSSSIPSIKPLMLVIGVRSSWAMLPMNWPRALSMVCSRAAMLLKVVANSASSSQPFTGARAVKSPLPSWRAAALICSMGAVILRVSSIDTIMASSRMQMAEMQITLRLSSKYR